MMCPDELVAYVVEQVALDGVQGTAIASFWAYVTQQVPQLDAELKRIVWAWTAGSRAELAVGLVDSDDALPEDRADLAALEAAHGDRLCVYASEDIQWKVLTGFPRAGNKLGYMPFVLLSAITRAREKGITAIEAAKITGQDPRSIFQRIVTLVEMKLIKKYPVVLNGSKTTFLLSLKFAQADAGPDAAAAYTERQIDNDKLRRDIVGLLKAAKNGLRQRSDLQRQLGMHVSRYHLKVFLRCLTFLEEQGYIQRVLVVRTSDSGERQHRCLKFLKDLPEKDKLPTDELDFQDADDADKSDDDANVSKGLSDREDTAEPFEAREEDDVQELPETSHVPLPSFTRLFPLENQLYNVVASRQEEGISSMELMRLTVGQDFYRIFSGVLDRYVDTSINSTGSKNRSSQPPHLGQYSLVRGTDSFARMKYYRYFTLPAYKRFLREPMDDSWGTFEPPTTDRQFETIDDLFSTIPARAVSAIQLTENASGERVPAWHGNVGLVRQTGRVTDRASPRPSDSPAPKRGRGRPRKSLADGTPSTLAEPAPPVEAGEAAEPQTPTRAVPAVPAVPAAPAAPEASEASAAAAGPAPSTPVDVDVTPAPSLPQTPVSKPDGPVMTPVSRFVREDSAALGRRSRSSSKTRTPGEAPFSIVALQRQNIILHLLEQKQGIMEGGLTLLAPFQAEWGQIASSKVDRRTLGRDINSLLEKGKLQRFCVSIMDDKGYPSTKWILLSPDIDVNSARVTAYRDELIERERNKARTYERKQLEVISHDFSFYHIKPKQTKKELARLQRQAELALRATKLTEEQQAAATDKLKKRMEERHNKRVAAGKKARTFLDEAEESEKDGRGRKRKFQSNDPLAAYTRPGKKPKAELDGRRKSERADEPAARRSRNTAQIGFREAEQFYRLVIITRSVYGGPGRTIDWKRVAEALGEPYTADTVRSRWPKLRKLYGGSRNVDKAAKNWETIFLEAYKAGRLPAGLDVGNMDLAVLAEFWRDNDSELKFSGSALLATGGNQAEILAALAASRREREREWEFVREDIKDNWLDSVHSFVSSVKMDENLGSVPFAYACDEPPAAADDALDRVKQLIKSIIATEEDRYDAQRAKVLLERFGSDVCSRAVKAMEKDKILVYVTRDMDKRAPGRNFAFSDRFNSLVRLRTGDHSVQAAGAFFKLLHRTFSESKGMIMSRMASDSSMICLMNLIAEKQVDLVRVNLKSGKLLEGYISRSIDRESLDCDMVLRSNAEAPIPVAAPRDVPVPGLDGPAAPPPDGAERTDGEVLASLPRCAGTRTWIDVNGALNRPMWTKLANLVAMTVALHPGIPRAELLRKFAPVLTPVEAGEILDWLVAKAILDYRAACGRAYWVQGNWFNSI
ncbi:uncharacterized protein V1510DRAFT_393488 [Dipodascopsis tothii]|uniref:uncharacterized protein n=1 Tax=Dipodascopsis tothii TaxID=44089 RepID=UPI0034CFF568